MLGPCEQKTESSLFVLCVSISNVPQHLSVLLLSAMTALKDYHLHRNAHRCVYFVKVTVSKKVIPQFFGKHEQISFHSCIALKKTAII